MAKGFFEKHHVQYLLNLHISINRPHRKFNYVMELGKGYLHPDRQNPLILEKGKLVQQDNVSISVLRHYLEQWELAIRTMFSDKTILVRECSLSVKFEDESFMQHMNVTRMGKNLQKSEAIYNFIQLKNHLKPLTGRNVIKTIPYAGGAFVHEPPIGEEPVSCNIL